MFIGGLARFYEPRLLGQAFLLERRDLVLVAQRQFDVVESIQQAMLAKRRDFEWMLGPVWLHDPLAGQVDRQTVVNVCRHLVEQAIDNSLGQDDRQQTILRAIVEKNVGKARCDDGAKSELQQRPRRVLA
jgi:hypothetical protein